MTAFLYTEPCPVCGSAVHLTDTGTSVTQVCPACGWTCTWELVATKAGSR